MYQSELASDINAVQNRNRPGNGNGNGGGSGGGNGNGNGNGEESEPNDAVGIWARANRYLISQDLERRLRLAGYTPDYNPDDMSKDVWRNEYGVSPFELETLKRLYETRYVRSPVIFVFSFYKSDVLTDLMRLGLI
jgi:hypothetical protein